MSPEPVFPGGMETSPEATASGCAHPPCLCSVQAGQTHCCRVCARASDDQAVCHCAHFGCTGRAF